jgi:RNA polymerase sigma factor (TIGR02999 family)
MRRILCDRARARYAGKRGGKAARLTLSAAEAQTNGLPVELIDLVQLDDALTKLAAMSERQARVVEMRYFAGLSVEEAAEALGTSPATVKREWTFARTWLKRELTGGPDTSGADA